MSLNLPNNSEEVENRIKVDVAREAPDSNPYLANSWLGSILTAFGRRLFDFYRDLSRTTEQLFPDTVFLTSFIIRWGAIFGKTQQAASPSNGRAVATGIAGSSITSGTILSSNGNEYISTVAAVISDITLTILSITRSGTTATVKTVGDHNLASNVPATISGANESEYNVIDADIVVTGLDTFTYQVIGSPATPATGSPLLDFTSASIQVESVLEGQDKNLIADSPVTLQAPIAGVDNELKVDFGQIGGGTDQESLASLQERTLDKIQNPVAHYNVSDIKDKAREVPGVTRVFVDEAGDIVGSISITSINRTGNIALVVTASTHNFEDGQRVTITDADQGEYNVIKAAIIVIDSTTFAYAVSGAPVTPATGVILSTVTVPLGQTIVYFMRDNDSNPIPSASEVQDVKNELNKIRPANTSEQDLIVNSPTAIVVDFTFTNITPDTSTMRSAITANLEQFFSESSEVGSDLDEDAYRSAIINTIDTETGQKLQSFVLSTPSGDIVSLSNEIPVLGAVAYP